MNLKKNYVICLRFRLSVKEKNKASKQKNFFLTKQASTYFFFLNKNK
jgi:hypothetical protein